MSKSTRKTKTASVVEDLTGVPEGDGNIEYDASEHEVPVPEVTETVEAPEAPDAPQPETEVVESKRKRNAAPPPKLPPSVARALGETGAGDEMGEDDKPERAWFADEAESYDGFVVIDDGVHRAEIVYFSAPPESLCELIEDMPVDLSNMLGAKVKDLMADGALEKQMALASYEVQLEAKRYLSGIHHKLRTEPNVVKKWTFGREVTPTNIEALPAFAKQQISQAIINYVLSGEREQSFTGA